MTAFQRGDAERRAAQLGIQRDLFRPADDALAAAERAQFRSTRYETVAPLLDRLQLPGGTWVEPCAGTGALTRHVDRWRAERSLAPLKWIAVELCDAPALRQLGEDSGGRVRVYDALDWRHVKPGGNPAVVITNWPWYGWGPLAAHALALYPDAHVVGLSCLRELLDDGGRADWFGEHPADIHICRGRQRFDGLDSKGQPAGKYPHPVGWFHWPPGERGDRRPAWSLLPPFRQETK